MSGPEEKAKLITQAAKKIQENPASTTLIALITAASVAVTGLDASGVKIFPWASAADVKQFQDDSLKRDEAIMAQLKEMAGDNRILMRSFWEQKREEAEAELLVNPNSRSARSLKQQAERELARLDRLDNVMPNANPNP